MAIITHVPPSIPLILKRIEHYEILTKNSTCDAQHACFSLVLAELDLLMEELIKDN